MNDRLAGVALDGRSVAILNRRQRSATLSSPGGDPEPGDFLIHLFLMAAGSVFGRWRGAEAFHAGAVLGRGGAWALVGDSGMGKSSFVAALASRGRPVLSDDLLIVQEGCGLAGPRCVDLRPEPAARLGLDEQAVPTRGGERRRLALGPVAPRVPIAGWIFLAWGGEIHAQRLPPDVRLRRIAEERLALGAGLKLPPVDPAALLELARLPAWELSRPHGLSSLGGSVDLLDELTS